MNRRLELFVLSLLLPPALLACYWSFTYTGLYRWLAEIQIEWLGGYMPAVTFVYTMLLTQFLGIMALGVLALAMLALDVILVRCFGFSLTPLRKTSSRAESSVDHQETTSMLSYMQALGPAIVLIGVGLFICVPALTVGEITNIDVAAIESGAKPKSRNVVLHGRLLLDVARSHGESANAHVFAPLVSDQWKPDTPVAVFVKLSEFDVHRHREEPDGESLKGVLRFRGLPGAVRTSFEKEGPRPGKNHWLLMFDHDTTVDIIGGGILVGIGLVLLLFRGVRKLAAGWRQWRDPRV